MDEKLINLTFSIFCSTIWANLRGIIMITKKDEKKLIIVDVICLILSAFGLMFFTWMFGITESNFKYVFILFDLYALYSFMTSGIEVDLYFKRRKIRKNSLGKINLTSLENVSIL